MTVGMAVVFILFGAGCFGAGFFVGGNNARKATEIRKQAEKIALERLEELKKVAGIG